MAEHKSFSTIVVGGGPAGLFAAVNLPEGSTLILEKKESPGKKLLIAGTGRCNITHEGDIADFTAKYGGNGSFLKKALREFTNSNTVRFFTERGLPTIIDKNGKVFPATEKSRDVLRVLLGECAARKVEIAYNEAVVDVAQFEHGFRVKTAANTYLCQHLVLATGGCSYPTTGSAGDGYRIAEQLGHTVVAPRPALTPIFVKDFAMDDLAGVSLVDVPIYLYRDGKKINEHSGDIGFTHKGLSGPGIIDFSRYMQAGDEVKVNFIGVHIDSLRSAFMDAAAAKGSTTIQQFLREYELPKSLAKEILLKVGVEPSCCLSNVTAKSRNLLLAYLCEYPFTIERLGGFKVAMATAGGVNLKEVSAKTLESKVCKGLFFAGEVLDVDGDTGGYNIQAAFSTGFLVAKSITTR
ncbi:NAD(P)/FAD-dependent oxidoreductase [uncultured Acetobacteroides sp.]|uniref:NAD(P)/FAD-dependent oxidoreductase n=1 Tax=uncultured Acetobacteroides sp. TaxID=1760811 RepID=UPI0029F493B6|nr:NAD(P)/FAD-dependent oxidoreductase [uncultured Acetobacteroides sp.]